MLDTCKVLINDDFIVEKFDNEVLLYTITETNAIYLNETAHLVWLLCKEQLSVGEMIEALMEQYPDHKGQIRDDVIASLKSLKDNGAIRFVDE